LRNVILDFGKESDLFIESFKSWALGLNSVENLFSHPFKGLIFFLFSIFVGFSVTLFSWINTSIKESLEALLKGFFPKELFIFILTDELSRSLFNVLKVVENQLH
jgi:hypothetical protein